MASSLSVLFLRVLRMPTPMSAHNAVGEVSPADYNNKWALSDISIVFSQAVSERIVPLWLHKLKSWVQKSVTSKPRMLPKFFLLV